MAADADAQGGKLDALNFFLADVRDGLGPYLAIYLLTEQKWDEASIGTVMSVGTIAGVIAQTPAGSLIDETRAKRAVIIAAALAVTLATLALPWFRDFPAVAALNAVTGIGGAVFAPALAAITLGIVGPKVFTWRVSRNEAFNHAGNAAAGVAAGATAYVFGPIAVFWIMAALAVASIAVTLTIPGEAIDDNVARGLDKEGAEADAEQPSGWQTLVSNRGLLVFAVCVVLLHLANAAMLPLVGQKLALVNKELGTTLTAVCIVIAQAVMVPMAILVGARADDWGPKPLFLAGFAILALRGFLYPVSDNPYWLVGVQALDGVGAGIFGALFPIIVRDLTEGTGRFNVSRGVIATAQGIGAAVSTALAGWIVVTANYNAAFYALAAVAIAGFALFLGRMPETSQQSRGDRVEEKNVSAA
jgi:MFS family permease